MVLHLFDERLVEAEAVGVVLGDEGLEDEPQALSDLDELGHIIHISEDGVMG